MTALFNTSRWRLFVEKSATATVCVQDRTALKTSWLYLFPAISVLRTFSTIWDWWFQSEHLGSADSYVSFYLTKQAKGRKETEHFCSSKYIYNQRSRKNAKTKKNVFGIKAKWLHFKRLFSGLCILRRGKAFSNCYFAVAGPCMDNFVLFQGYMVRK